MAARLATSDLRATLLVWQAYKRRWRFYKIMQMCEKLLLLAITLYTPQASDIWLRLCGATVISGVSTVIAVITQPLGDVLEVTLDSTSRYVRLVPHAMLVSSGLVGISSLLMVIHAVALGSQTLQTPPLD